MSWANKVKNINQFQNIRVETGRQAWVYGCHVDLYIFIALYYGILNITITIFLCGKHELSVRRRE